MTDLKCKGTEKHIKDCQTKFTPLPKDEPSKQMTPQKEDFFKESDALEKAKAKQNNVAGVVCNTGPISYKKGILFNGTSTSNGNVFMINKKGFLGNMR